MRASYYIGLGMVLALGCGCAADPEPPPSDDARWAVALSRRGDDFPTQLKVAPDGSIVLLGTELTPDLSYDRHYLFIAKFASDGTVLWRTRLWHIMTSAAGFSRSALARFDLDDDGNILVFGHDRSDRLDNDLLLAKLSPGGHVLWLQEYEASGAQQSAGMGVDDENHLVVAGWAEQAPDFGGPPPSYSSGHFVARLDPDGNVVSNQLAAVGFEHPESGRVGHGRVCTTNGAGSDFAIGCFDLLGAVQWVHKPLSWEDGFGIANDMALADDGSVTLVGRRTTAIDLGEKHIDPGTFVERFDASGMVGHHALGEGAIPTAVALHPDGDVFVGGYGVHPRPQGPGVGAVDFHDQWVARFDGDDVTWAKLIQRSPSDAHEFDVVLAIAPDGAVVVAGSFGGSVVVDGQTVVAREPDDVDIYLARFVP